ncbi:MAG: chromate transporter [Acetatifactor sp.]|nr:chromate transporter [Acetatifactor sp.]
MRKISEALRLFLDFLKLGCFTFGGGWGIVAQMQRIYVEEKKSLTEEELIDLTSVARSLPGTMIGNVAMLFGYRMLGILGGFVCVLGIIMPPLLMLSIIALFYTAFRDNAWIDAAMSGVRAAVVPIIISAAVGMVKGSFKYSPCILVMLLTLGLYLFLHMSCIYLVLIGAVSGILITEVYERRGENK